MLTLAEVLEDPTLRPAAPVLVAGGDAVAGTQVRWVHSSEVVEIAALLSGGELLLTGGELLTGLRPAAQISYVSSLAARGVAALAVQSAGTGHGLPGELVAAAEQAGLPLIELRQVVPFVEVAEAVNRRIASSQLAALSVADSLSRELEEVLAAQPTHVARLVETTAHRLGARVRLADLGGRTLGEADVLGEVAEPTLSSTRLLVHGIEAAVLDIEHGPELEASMVEVVVARIRTIFALALSPLLQPSLTRLAGDSLVELIASGGGGDRLAELARSVGLPTTRPLAVALLERSPSAEAETETLVARALPAALTGTHDGWCVAVVPLQRAHADRGAALSSLRDAGLSGALGPIVPTIQHASRSLAEARSTYRIGRSSKWGDTLHDAADYLVERTAERWLPRSAVQEFTWEAMGEVVQYDAQHGTELVRTLDVWLSTGCNATAAAGLLFLERQSLHKRLKRIFELLGGDPRDRGMLGALSFAAKITRGNTRLREDQRD